MNTTQRILTSGIVAGTLLLGGASFARDTQHPQLGDDRGHHAQPGDDNGARHEAQPGDDKGAHRRADGLQHLGVLISDSRGRDDKGVKQEPQPGDDRGQDGKRDDRGRDGQRDNNGARNGNNAGRPVRVRVPLTGSILNGRLPQGHAEFRAQAGRTGLRVEAENVNLLDGTTLVVAVNGTPVGTLTLVGSIGELEMNSQDGDIVPAIGPGTVVTLLASNGALTVTVLAGHF